MAKRFVAASNFLVQGGAAIYQRAGSNLDGVIRQIVKQRAEVVEEQRQVVLDPSGGQAAADILVHAATADVVIETFVPGTPETTDGVGIEGKLFCRQKLEGIDPGDRPLRLGVEGSQALDLIVEQVDPHRLIATHGKDVHEAAAYRVFATITDDIHCSITGCVQACSLRLYVERIAGGELESLGGHEPLRGEPAAGSGQRHHQQSSGQARQAVQRRQSL